MTHDAEALLLARESAQRCIKRSRLIATPTPTRDSKYWESTDEAPPPLDNSGVQVRGSGGGVLDESQALGTLWFGGFAGPQDVAARKKALLEALAADDEWEALPGEPVLMQYNDPFTHAAANSNRAGICVLSRYGALGNRSIGSL